MTRPIAKTKPGAPLEGWRVLEFGGFIAGPGVGMRLSDLGAEVIKIEPLAGDPARDMGAYGRSILNNFNRGKRSIALDLQTKEGRELVLELIDSADVVVQNLSPGAMARLGLDADTLRKRVPGLIYLTINGYSSSGPSGIRRGFDGAVQAESGMMALNGHEGEPPLKVGFPIVDVATAHVGAEAVLGALIGRSRTGQGATLEVSMFDVAIHIQNVPLSTYLETSVEPPRTGNGLAHNAPAADLIATSDGYLVLSAYLQSHWQRLCEVIDRPDLIADDRFTTNENRVANRPALLAELTRALATFTTAAAIDLLGRNGLVVGVARSYRDLRDSAEFTSGQFILDRDRAGEEIFPVVRPPYQMGVDPQANPRAPRLGADTAALLGELDVPAEHRERLIASGVVSNGRIAIGDESAAGLGRDS